MIWNAGAKLSENYHAILNIKNVGQNILPLSHVNKVIQLVGINSSHQLFHAKQVIENAGKDYGKNGEVKMEKIKKIKKNKHTNSNLSIKSNKILTNMMENGTKKNIDDFYSSLYYLSTKILNFVNL